MGIHNRTSDHLQIACFASMVHVCLVFSPHGIKLSTYGVLHGSEPNEDILILFPVHHSTASPTKILFSLGWLYYAIR